MATKQTKVFGTLRTEQRDWSSNQQLRYLYFILGAIFVFVYTHGFALTGDATTNRLFVAVTLSFTFVTLARIGIDNWLFIQDPNLELVHKEFFISLGLYLTAGVTGFILLNQHPNEIASITPFKFFIGTLVYGYFVAVDNALNTERRCYYERVGDTDDRFQRQGRHLIHRDDKEPDQPAQTQGRGGQPVENRPPVRGYWAVAGVPSG